MLLPINVQLDYKRDKPETLKESRYKPRLAEFVTGSHRIKTPDQ